MNDCYFDKKDWRICRQEVSLSGALAESHRSRFNHLANEYARRRPADPGFIHIDGSLQSMLEEAGERSEDRDKGCMRIISPPQASVR